MCDKTHNKPVEALYLNARHSLAIHENHRFSIHGCNATNSRKLRLQFISKKKHRPKMYLGRIFSLRTNEITYAATSSATAGWSATLFNARTARIDGISVPPRNT